MDLSYQEVYTMNKTNARGLLIQTYLRTGSRPDGTALADQPPGAVLPPIVLDSISTAWVLGPGNHLLAQGPNPFDLVAGLGHY